MSLETSRLLLRLFYRMRPATDGGGRFSLGAQNRHTADAVHAKP